MMKLKAVLLEGTGLILFGLVCWACCRERESGEEASEGVKNGGSWPLFFSSFLSQLNPVK